jgi:alpha-methylacyl-CoA racemase
MLLADLGADVVRVDRVARGGADGVPAMEGLSRNRRSIAVDLKQPDGVALVLDLVAGADVLVEGFRPGVTERLGLGPDVCLARNPGLVYARMTGWGQDGPLAHTAGHDIGYAAIAGALHPTGRPDTPPPPPLNLVADFGGGGAFLAIGVLAALVERAGSGLGQVVDVAMVDGTASLTAFFHGLLRLGGWSTERGTNLLDGAAPFYDTYTCADGRHLALGAIEPQFHAELLAGLGIDPDGWDQHDRAAWPAQKVRIADVVATRTRDEWVEVFDGTDACVAPVLALDEAPSHPHLVARETFVEHHGVVEPAPAPRFQRTPGEITRPAPSAGQHTVELLLELGLAHEEIARLQADGVVVAEGAGRTPAALD